MHQSTQRLLCRVAFLLGCVVPTLCTLSWIAYRQSSWSVAAVEEQLSETVGLKCRIGRYFNPHPTKWVFQDVRLERAGQDAIRLPVLKAQLVDGTWQLAADRADVAWHARHRLWETMQETLLLGRTGNHPVELRVGEVRFSGTAMPSLASLTVRYDQQAKPNLSSTARVGTLPDAPALELTLQAGPTAPWRVQLATERVALAHLGQVLPQLKDLGPDAYYEGSMIFELNPSGPRVELAGIFHQIDLQQALASRFAQHGAGGANLYVESAVIQGESLHRAHGFLLAENGQVATRLVERAARHLRLRTAELTQERDLLAFSQLAIEFRLDQGRMTLSGHCDKTRPGMPPGTMLAGLSQPLVLESDVTILPATHLASVLCEEHEATVPASQASVDLARWLTVPQVAETPTGLLR